MTDQPPAPGWWKADDGGWHPPPKPDTNNTSIGCGFGLLVFGFLFVVGFIVLTAIGGGGVDWFDRADNARTCPEATQVLMDYVGSDDDTGLRGSGTHGYLSDRVDQLC